MKCPGAATKPSECVLTKIGFRGATMSRTMNVQIQASERDLEERLKHFLRKGWRIKSKQRDGSLGKLDNTYNWTVILEREDGVRQSASNADGLTKYKRLLDEDTITEREHSTIYGAQMLNNKRKAKETMKDNPFSTYVLMHQVMVARTFAKVVHIILAVASVIAGVILLGNHLPAAGLPILFGAPILLFVNWFFARLVFGHLYSVLTIRMEIEKQNDDKEEIGRTSAG